MDKASYGLVGVFVGIVASSLKDLLVAYFSKKKNARYLAVHVIFVLKKYVGQCLSVACDDGLDIYGNPNNDGSTSPQVDTPPHPEYPQDIDWKSITPNLMYECLALKSMAYEADRSIDAAAEHCTSHDNDMYFETRQELYTDLGLQALRLIETLSDTYDIPIEKSDLRDSEEHFKRIEAKIEARNEARAASNEKMFEEMSKLQK